MAINNGGLIRPKFGALFTHALMLTQQELTAFVGSIGSFSLTGTVPTGWTHWGHLSRSTLPSYSQDGGDVTSMDTWMQIGVESFSADLTESDEYTLNQVDAVTVSGLSALNGVNVTAAELWFSGADRYLKFWASNKGAWTQPPLASDVDGFADMKFRLSHQAPDVALNLASIANPEAGIGAYPNTDAPTMLIFDKTAFAA